MTNADNSGSWGACAFIITTFETNGKASRERERESLSLPLRLHTRFVHLFCRDCSWGRNVRQALPSKRTGVIRIGIAQARSGTFHLKHERCAPVHMLTAMPLTNTCIPSIYVRKPPQQPFVSEGKRCAALPVRCGPFASSEDRELDCFNFDGFIMCTCKQEACLCSV